MRVLVILILCLLLVSAKKEWKKSNEKTPPSTEEYVPNEISYEQIRKIVEKGEKNPPISMYEHASTQDEIFPHEKKVYNFSLYQPADQTLRFSTFDSLVITFDLTFPPKELAKTSLDIQIFFNRELVTESKVTKRFVYSLGPYTLRDIKKSFVVIVVKHKNDKIENYPTVAFEISLRTENSYTYMVLSLTAVFTLLLYQHVFDKYGHTIFYVVYSCIFLCCMLADVNRLMSLHALKGLGQVIALVVLLFISEGDAVSPKDFYENTVLTSMSLADGLLIVGFLLSVFRLAVNHYFLPSRSRGYRRRFMNVSWLNIIINGGLACIALYSSTNLSAIHVFGLCFMVTCISESALFI